MSSFSFLFPWESSAITTIEPAGRQATQSECGARSNISDSSSHCRPRITPSYSLHTRTLVESSILSSHYTYDTRKTLSNAGGRQSSITSLLDPPPASTSVQGWLLSSLLQNTQDRAVASSRNRHYKQRTKAASEAFGELRKRYPSSNGSNDYVFDRSGMQTPQSEYNASGGYGKYQKATPIIEEEVDDGLNEWGLPNLLIATRYDDEPEEGYVGQESEIMGSYLSTTPPVVHAQTKLASTNQLKPKYSGDSTTVVGEARSILSRMNTHRITLRALQKFTTLTYVVYITAPAVREKCTLFLTRPQQEQKSKSMVKLITIIISLSYLISLPSCIRIKRAPVSIKNTLRAPLPKPRHLKHKSVSSQTTNTSSASRSIQKSPSPPKNLISSPALIASPKPTLQLSPRMTVSSVVRPSRLQPTLRNNTNLRSSGSTLMSRMKEKLSSAGHKKKKQQELLLKQQQI